jgi:SAM-dependent methyltransferase
METTRQIADEQTKLWNGPAGQAWVDAQALLDQILAPFVEPLVEAALEGPGGRVLDVGCGTGATTLAVARRLGADARCVGVDISEPMIMAARARAERERTPARFLLADAQTYAFEPAGVDVIVSRFGVMFFDDFVAAFANLRRAATDQARLRVIAFRSPQDNPFMTTAERAAAPLLPNMPPRRPDGPGQFAFADQLRVRRILDESGWGAIDIRPIDVACAMPEKELVGYLTRFGPLGQLLRDADEETRARVVGTVRPAFDPYVQGDEVRFIAGCWTVDARAAALKTPRA